MMTTTPKRRELLTPEQAAERLGLKNSNTLAVWRSEKRYPLPFIKIGRNIRYDAAEVEKFIERNTKSGDAA
jgi:excisionase family DNA binding protein